MSTVSPQSEIVEPYILLELPELPEVVAPIVPLQSLELPPANQSAAKWQVFTSTFLTIFFAEMGDKTQIATLLMAAESHSPWVIFAGAATALVATSLVGVLLGRWLATRLSPKTLDRSAAIMLLVVAAMLGWEVIWG